MATESAKTPAEPVAAPSAPAAPAAPAPAPESSSASAPASAAAVPAAAATPPATAAAESTPKAPSLLAAADAGKHAHAGEGKPADGAGKPGDAASGDTAKPDAASKPDDAAAKPAEAKAPPSGESAAKPETTGEKKPEDGEPAAAKPPEPPTYEAYKLPEGVKYDDGRMAEFNKILGAAELTGKADHAAMQALGQQLVEFHAAEVKRIAAEVERHQVDVWNRMKEGWINQLKSDPELGGNRIETTLGNAKYAFENYLGLDKTQQAELLAVMDNAGVSDHPLMVRALHRLYERLAESGPAQPTLPNLARGQREPGNRGWYASVDGASAA